MNARARNFLNASEASPVVYGSVDGGCVTYRLANGKVFHLNAAEARQAPNPRWAFKDQAKVINGWQSEEDDLLARMLAESQRPELLPEGGR